MLDILELDLPDRLGIPAYRIDGGVAVEERQPVIDQFSQQEGPAVMVLNPRAAGIGLNITSASHVIHYSREWNPAVEDQATDRAYRIGQEQRVIVHYMYYLDTIDHLIADRLLTKRNLAGQLVMPTDEKDTDRIALVEALELVPHHTTEEMSDDYN